MMPSAPPPTFPDHDPMYAGTALGSPAVRTSIREALSRIRDVRVGVVGDLILDRFEYGIPTRISREGPLVVLKHDRTLELPGGAANTAANVRSIGAAVSIIGVIGQDPGGDTLRRLFETRGISSGDQRLLPHPTWPTTTKTRILGGLHHATPQQLCRIDRERALPAEEGIHAFVRDSLRSLWPWIGALIVSDYGLGVVTPELLDAVRTLQAERRIPVVVDTHMPADSQHGVTSMTPNIHELEAAIGDPSLSTDEPRLKQAGDELRNRLGLEALLVTRGRHGMMLFEQSRDEPLVIPVFGNDQIADVTGAGDTVIASYTSALATGASFETAARLANIAGGLSVMKQGTATISASELTQALLTS